MGGTLFDQPFGPSSGAILGQTACKINDIFKGGGSEATDCRSTLGEKPREQG